MWKLILHCIILSCIFLIFSPDSNSGERIEEVSWPDVGLNYFYAESGGNAADTTLTLNNYNVMNASLTESFDTNECFTIVSGNEICYNCVPSINAHISFDMSVTKTVSTAAAILTVAIGIGATTTIDDGDEEGEEYGQFMAGTNGRPEILAIMKSIQLDTDDCIAVLGKVNDTTGGSDYGLDAVNVVIHEF